MNNIGKILLGLGVVTAAVAVTACVVEKATEKKYATVSDISEEVTEVEDKSFIEKIKAAAYKKVVKILSFVIIHKDQIEAVGTLIGLAAGVIGVINSVKEYRTGNKMAEQLEELCAFKEQMTNAWDNTVDAYNDNWDATFKKMNDIHLDLGMLHEVHETICCVPVKKKKVA